MRYLRTLKLVGQTQLLPQNRAYQEEQQRE